MAREFLPQNPCEIDQELRADPAFSPKTLAALAVLAVDHLVALAVVIKQRGVPVLLEQVHVLTGRPASHR